MNISELAHMKEFFNVWKKVDGYKHLGVCKHVCGGDVAIIGSKIRPKDIVCYGSVKEIAMDFSLTEDEVLEALRYINS